MNREINRHHLYWTRKSWDSLKLSSELRNHPLSIQPLLIPIHNELHADIPPIEPPSARIARTALEHIYSLPESYTPLDATKSLSDRLYTYAPEYSDHLFRQIPYIELSARALKRKIV